MRTKRHFFLAHFHGTAVFHTSYRIQGFIRKMARCRFIKATSISTDFDRFSYDQQHSWNKTIPFTIIQEILIDTLYDFFCWAPRFRLISNMIREYNPKGGVSVLLVTSNVFRRVFFAQVIQKSNALWPMSCEWVVKMWWLVAVEERNPCFNPI